MISGNFLERKADFNDKLLIRDWWILRLPHDLKTKGKECGSGLSSRFFVGSVA